MNPLRRALQLPPVLGLTIGALVFAAVLGVRAAGWLQRAELRVYDQMMRWGAHPETRDERIVICGMTEDDLRKYGHPLPDVKLAELLETVAAQEPCVIGLDIFRDLPEPRSREGIERLEAVLRKLENVVAIDRMPTIPPPPALADLPDRTAPNYVPEDWAVDGVRRRAFVFLEGRSSLAAALALRYFAANGVHVEQVGRDVKFGAAWLPRVTPDAGGYVRLPLDESGGEDLDFEILLDFRGARQFAPYRTAGGSYSFADVLDGKLPEGALRGRIVLVAVITDSVKDSDATPIDDNLRGVTQHAVAVHHLLRIGIDGVPPLRWWPEAAEVAWIITATLLGAGAGAWCRTPWTLAPAVAALLAIVGLAAWAAFARGVWIPAAAPALGVCVAATFGASLGALLERTDRRTMSALFSKHVSSRVAAALWEEREHILEGGHLKPQQLTATIFFTDLKDFATVSEGMPPAKLLEWMNEYMNGIARHVEPHGGVVSRFMGDAIMAIFGAPVARKGEAAFDEDAVRAVECALAMRAELQTLNERWRTQGLPQTAMRVGIHTGDVVAGSLGSEERIEFTVFGDSVNTAARLESAGKQVPEMPEDGGCTILIGDTTEQRVRGRFVTHCVGPMELKGKKNIVIVHRVVSAIPRPLA